MGTPPTPLQAALSLAERGYRVFPLKYLGRTPTGKKNLVYRKDWPTLATCDPGTVRALFAQHPDYTLVGIATDGLAVVDIDPRNGGKELDWQTPESPRVRTASNGLHLYYRTEAPLRGGNDALGRGIDLKTGGRMMVIAPGSVIDGHIYREQAPLPHADDLPTLPAHVVEQLRAARDASNLPTPDELLAPGDDPDDRLAAVREIVAMIPNDHRFNRERWVGLAHAVRAATDDDIAALEVFDEFSQRLLDDTPTSEPYDPEEARKAFESANPPHQHGFEYLVSLVPDAGVRAQLDGFDVDPDAKPTSTTVPTDDTALGTAEAEASEQSKLDNLLKRVQTLSRVKRRRIGWLWEGLIAFRELNMLYGDGDIGKSMMYCWIAAMVTTGRFGPARDVLIITAEDDVETILEPRIAAAGGDLDRVHTFRMDGNLPHCTQDIIRLVKHFDVGLVIIDPIASFLGGETDTFKDSEVRAALRPLQYAIRDTNAAVLFSIHTNKRTTGSDTHRINGSVAFRNIVRSALGVTFRPGSDEERALFQSKKNIGRKQRTRLFTIGEVELDFDGRLDKIGVVQMGDECDLTAAQCLAGVTGDKQETSAEQAKKFAQEILLGYAEEGATEVPSRDVLNQMCKEGGFASKTAREAISAVFGKSRPKKGEPSGTWYLKIPQFNPDGGIDDLTDDNINDDEPTEDQKAA